MPTPDPTRRYSIDELSTLAGVTPRTVRYYIAEGLLDRPAGERVIEVLVGGEPLDPARTYIAAINDFMAGGGDGYGMLARGNILIGPADGTLLASELIDYIAAKGTVAPKVEGRIVIE